MQILIHNFGDLPVFFNNNAWVNATKVAAHFDKRLDNYFDNLDTKEYMEIVKEDIGAIDNNAILMAKRGHYGGTWMHPDLVVHFSRWLNPKFGHWCDKQIRHILSSPKEYAEWVRYRHETASSNKVLNAVIKRTLERDGIEALPEHYIAEVLMINQAITGEYQSIERDKLLKSDLDLLGKLEILNAVLFAGREPFEKRKAYIEQTARNWQKAHR
jgi:hypothetical protein